MSEKFEREVIDSLARIEVGLENQGRELEEVRDDIYGNGDAGLKERMATQEERTDGGGKMGALTGAIAAGLILAGDWLRTHA